jgi:chromosome segregation ATPase
MEDDHLSVELGDEPYANEENKQLGLQVREKRRQVTTNEERIKEHHERVKIMYDHLVNVQQELVSTQQLVDAKRHETQTEDHFKQLAQRELGRYKAEMQRLNKLLDEYQDQVNSYSNELMRGNEKLDQFKLEMNWNQEELEQWAIAARQKEEDETTLEKYRRADDSKVRELTLAVERLTVENAQRRKDLADQVTETQSKQIEIDKTAELFKTLHEDRRKIISQWEEAVNNMQSRDGQLDALSREYAQNQELKKQKEDKMKEKKRQHEEVNGDNEKMNNTIDQTDRQLVQIRTDHMKAKDSINNFKDEVEVLKNQLTACEKEKNDHHNQHQVQSRNLEFRQQKHEQMQKHLQAQNRGLDEAVFQTKERDGASKMAEKQLNDMMNNLAMVEKEMKAAKENLYKESQALHNLRSDEATTLGEISGAQSAIKNLQFQISRLDAERQRQQELLYAVDFQSQLMQRKVARVSGERTVEERDDFNKKVEVLDEQIKEQKKLHTILSSQNKRQDAELKNASRALAGVQKQAEGMKYVMEELELENSTIKRTMDKSIKEKEEALMQHDILKLEVKRLRQNMEAKSGNLYSIQNRKQQLQISMEEREKEIEVHKEVLRSQLRVAQEESHKSAIELAERKQKIYNLKSKYENIMCKVKKEDGEEQFSQAHYMIKAAQDKEELQRQGDELDDKIRKAEKEIRSLENTLGHLVSRNQRYKENFQKANEQSQADIEEKQMLEEQARAANEVLFRNKKRLAQLEREEEEDRQRNDELTGGIEQLEKQVGQLTASRDQLQQEIGGQAAKLERAEQALEVTKRRATQAGIDVGPEAPATLEIETKSLRDQNQSVLHALNNALQDSAVEDVLRLFQSLSQEHNLPLSSRPPSVASSRPSSRGGSSLGGRAPV